MTTNDDLEYRQATAAEATEAAQGNWPDIETGQDTVTTAGTAVQLNGGTSLPIPDGASVAVRANSDNTGPVYVGDSTVDAATGFEKTPGDGVAVNVTDVNAIWIDADNAGDGVTWLVEVDN